MYLEADGLQLACEVPVSREADKPFDVVVVVGGCEASPTLKVSLAVGGRAPVGVEARETSKAGSAYGFAVRVPALNADEVAVVTVEARDGERQVPRRNDRPAAVRIAPLAGPVRRRPSSDDAQPPKTLGELAAPFMRPSVRTLIDKLHGLGVTTPDELLVRCGSGGLPGLTTKDEKIVGRLVQHAALATLPLSPLEISRLVDAGIGTPDVLAASPEEIVAPLLQRPDGAGALIAVATAQLSILSALEIGRRVSLARVAPALDESTHATGDCSCEDCRAATSPMAYLADLLGYIRQRLTSAGVPITVADLTRMFCQPLSDLPIDCSTSDEDVSQVRLVVESLEELLRREFRGIPDVAVAPIGHSITFVVAADVDGDGCDELVLGFDEVFPSLGDPPRSGLWVMRYDREAERWRHLRPGTDRRHASLLLPAGMHAASGFAARIKSDSGASRGERQQIVMRVTSEGDIGARFWVLQYEPTAATVEEAWTHLAPEMMAGFGADLVMSVDTIEGAFGADVDGDGLDEFVAYGVAPPDTAGGANRPDAFWVFDFDGRSWSSLGAPGSTADVAFTCASAVDPSPVGIRLAVAGDVDVDGRAEIVAVPHDLYGRFVWVMRYDGTPGMWSHVTPSGQPLDADINQPAPGPTTHALVGSVSSINRPDLLLARGEWPGADVNRIVQWRYEPPSGGLPAHFAEETAADAAAAQLPADLAILADVDGDGKAELVLLTHQGRGTTRRNAGWVLDQDSSGTWTHLTPILGHPFDADLEWTAGGVWPVTSVLAADVDGDGRQELVLSRGEANEIWVLDLDPASNQWRHLSPVIRPDAARRYSIAAYEALLLHSGTTFADLRQGVSAGEKERAAHAERLGVSSSDTRPDALDALVLDPATLEMEQLEEVFGLASTRRDALSQGPVAGADSSQVRRWRINGARWSADPVCATTDPDGLVHLNIWRDTQGRAVVTAYRDGAHAAPVSLGEGPVQGTVWLQDLGSGLSGSLTLDLQQSNAVVNVRVFPALAVHRWRRLRDQWDSEDVPDDPYRPGEPTGGTERRPLVDPAVIGPDDFRLPLPKAGPSAPDGPFDLWIRRRKWLDGVLDQLRATGENVDALLDSMRPAVGSPPRGRPWASAPTDLESLRTSITTGTPSRAAASSATVLTALHLPVDAFLRLMDLRELSGASSLGSEGWAEFRSILALAHRRSRFTVWRAEERAARVRLDAASFVTADWPVEQRAWPPEPLTTDELPPGGAPPLIDPDRVATGDLPRSIAGDEARALWARRASELAGNASTITAARAAGWEQQLVAALGQAPSTAVAWSTWISDRAAELEDPDNAVVARSVAAVHAKLGGMGIAAFRRVADVTSTFGDGRIPAAAAWTDAERSLTATRKVMVLYPAWRAEEGNPQRPWPYWRVHRFALTPWLAPAEDRDAWLAALASRCRPPVVDPDLVPLESIRTGSVPGLACAAERLHGERLSELYQHENALRGAVTDTASASNLERVDATLLKGLWTEAESDVIRADLADRRTATSAQTVVDQVFGSDADRLPSLRAALDAGGPPAAEALRAVLGELGFTTEVDFLAVTDRMASATTGSAAEVAAFDGAMTRASLMSRLTRAERIADGLGLRIRDVVAPLRLDLAGWRRLLTLRALARSGGPLFDSECSDLVDILIRSYKERRFGVWQAGEQDVPEEDRVRLGPDSFTLSAETWTPEESPSWRVRPPEPRSWRATLRSRTEQHNAVLAALREAWARVEETTLPAYRDELLAALPVASTEPGAGARWASDHLLVDTAEAGVRRTARVAHAIDGMLSLLWSVRTGQLVDTYPDLWLDAPTFDQDWRWIGSYATWRSAILVHLYPENLLRPTLRRYQTPALEDALEELRSARQLSSAQARRITARYASYLSDVCRLDQQRIVCAGVSTAWTPLLLEATPGSQVNCQLMATVSEASRRVYWALKDITPAAGKGYSLSFWHQLPAFAAGDVTTLVGATNYVPANWVGGRRWLFLFAQTRDVEGQHLAFARYDLATATWDADATPLEPPPGASEFAAFLLPTPEGAPPRVGFEWDVLEGDQRQTVRRARSLNAKGTGWAREDFKPLAEYGTWNPVGSGSADYENEPISAARALLSGDVDGDGRDELIILPAGVGTPLVLRYDGATWAKLPDPSHALQGGHVVVGRFTATHPADRHDDIVQIDGIGGSTRITSYDGASGGWKSIKTPVPPDIPVGVSLAVAGDFDGDGLAELAVAGRHHGISGISWPGTSAFWVLGATPSGMEIKPSLVGSDPSTVDHRSSVEKLRRAAFRCAPWSAMAHTDAGTAFPSPGFLVSGDFDGDGRDEIAAALAPLPGGISQGNDFWVMDIRAASGKWAPLGQVGVNPEYPLHTVLDLSPEELLLWGAVSGDFDGDDRDEILVIPVEERLSTGSVLLVADFQPGNDPADPAINGRWGSLPSLNLSASVRAAGNIVVGDFDGDGADEVVVLGPGQIWLRKFDVAAGEWIELPSGLLNTGDPAGFAFGVSGNFLGTPGTPLIPRRGARVERAADQVALQPGTMMPVGPPVKSSTTYPTMGPPYPFQQRYITGIGTNRTVLTRRLDVGAPHAAGCKPSEQLVPNWPGGSWELDETVPAFRRAKRTKNILLANAKAPATIMRYLEEALYDLPIAVASTLQASHDYNHALDWYRLVYDYSEAGPRRKTYYGLVADEHGTAAGEAPDTTAYARDLLAWVRDPLDPHAIAAIRPHSYTRGTLQMLIRCLLDYADAEFTRDTPESVERARVLYGTARDLLDDPVLCQRLGRCEDVVVRIPAVSADRTTATTVNRLGVALGRVADRAAATAAAHQVGAVLDSDAAVGSTSHGKLVSTTERLLAAERIVARTRATAAPPSTLAAALRADASALAFRSGNLPSVLGAANARALADLTARVAHRQALVIPGAPGIAGANFCVGPNPVLAGLRLHTQLNLFKLRTGRNIAGMRRALDLYAGPTDRSSGLPMIGADGELVLPGLSSLAPTPYRYTALIEQARALASQAREAEALMLAALEKRDVEALSLLRARQDVRIAQAGVQLQELRVRQAEDRVAVAQLQQERASFEEQHYADLVAGGLLHYEREALSLLGQAVGLQVTAAIASFSAASISAAQLAWSGSASNTASGLSALASNASIWSQWNTMQAGFARTQQGWRFQQQLSRFERTIAGAHLTVETDGVRIAEQERMTSEIQADTAEQLMEFQQAKFTNVDLYDWMSEVLERTYRWYLQQATSMAQLAAAQLAFERQEGNPPTIQADYWEPLASGFAAATGEGSGPDRRGITGAERLLQNIAELEQYAFATNRRKQQLTRTISLALLDPLGLARLRSDGVVTFVTPMRLFDEDFPGHHLRLIRRVSLSVVALIPPSEGIRATLSTTGTSRVVIGPEVFQTITLRRGPESMSLTGAVGANGLFTFEPPTGLRDPFEGLGVDTVWELRMPRPANPFDFSSIADVLLTLDYTAIDSPDLRVRVVRELDRAREGERGFSLRQEFPDAWWDLSNPEAVPTPLSVSFATASTDFPANVDELEIAHVAVALVTVSSPPAPLSTVLLKFTEVGSTAVLGGVATPVDRVVSTRRSNGGPWLPITGKVPSGLWQLKLPDSEEVRDWIAHDQLIDVLLVISYRGRTPPWPS